MTRFENIRRLWKRASHFCSQKPVVLGKPLRGLSAGKIQPAGMGIAVHNYSLMRSNDDSYLDRLQWLDQLAASMNRYIDQNKIADDENALRCLRWWRAHLFFHPEAM